jgi:hypothetical protein
VNRHRQHATRTKLAVILLLDDAWGKLDQAARWRAEREKLSKPPEPLKAK